MIPSNHKSVISLRSNNSEVKETCVLASPYNKAGALMTCLPSLHLLHLKVSCVSQSVFSLNWKSCRNMSTEKCRSVSSFSSTTADDKACLDACRWKIFSSIVPVEMNRYTKPMKENSSNRCQRGVKASHSHSFFWPSRHTRAKACWSAAGFQSTATHSVPSSNIQQWRKLTGIKQN